jgi:hypothetical protein
VHNLWVRRGNYFRATQAEVDLPDARTAHSHDGSFDDSSRSPEVALEGSDNADDDRTRGADQTGHHAVRLQIHRGSPAARLLDSRVQAAAARRNKPAAGESNPQA